MMTDGDLLQRYIADHSEPAFAELVNRHLTLVYSTALRRVGGDTHLAQDVTQTVFTALARKALALSNRTALAGWLYLGTHHAAAQIIRSQRRRQVREHEAHAMQDLLSSSTTSTDWEQVSPVLDDALRELSEADREAVLLRFFQQRPFVEIGAALHLSENAARMRVERALDKLHSLLARRGVKSTTAALAVVCANQAMVAAPTGFATYVTGAALMAAITTGSASSVGTIFLMTNTTWSVSIFALAATALGLREFNERRAAEAVNFAQETELAALRANLRTSEERLAAGSQNSTRPQSGARSDKGLVSSVSSSILAPAAPTPSDLLVEDQKRRQPFREKAIEEVNSTMFDALKWSPVQRELFKKLSVLRLEEGDRLLGQSGITREELQEKLTNEFLSNLRSAVGDEAAQQYQYYDNTNPARILTTQLASLFLYTDSPVTGDQAKELVAIIAANSSDSSGRVEWKSANVEAIIGQAQKALSSSQVEQLSKLLSERVMPKNEAQPSKSGSGLYLGGSQ